MAFRLRSAPSFSTLRTYHWVAATFIGELDAEAAELPNAQVAAGSQSWQAEQSGLRAWYRTSTRSSPRSVLRFQAKLQVARETVSEGPPLGGCGLSMRRREARQNAPTRVDTR